MSIEINENLFAVETEGDLDAGLADGSISYSVDTRQLHLLQSGKYLSIGNGDIPPLKSERWFKGFNWRSITGLIARVLELETSINSLDKSDVGLGNVDNTSDANKPVSTATQTALDTKVPITRTVAGHALNSDVTVSKSDVGLGSVDNTADTAKPVSTSQQTALDLKLSKASNLSDLNSASVARTNLGLGNVDNTSDVNKPVSAAQQTAINASAFPASVMFDGNGDIEPTDFAGTMMIDMSELTLPDTVTADSFFEADANLDLQPA